MQRQSIQKMSQIFSLSRMNMILCQFSLMPPTRSMLVPQTKQFGTLRVGQWPMTWPEWNTLPETCTTSIRAAMSSRVLKLEFSISPSSSTISSPPPRLLQFCWRQWLAKEAKWADRLRNCAKFWTVFIYLIKWESAWIHAMYGMLVTTSPDI